MSEISPATRPSSSGRVQRVLETCLYVDELGKAERFYADILGLTLIGKQEGRHVFFRCGQQMLLIFNPDESERSHDIPPHGSRGDGHVAFAINEDDIENWRARLASAGVQIECDYTWPGGGRSLYFRDPAGNSLELATPCIWGL